MYSIAIFTWSLTLRIYEKVWKSLSSSLAKRDVSLPPSVYSQPTSPSNFNFSSSRYTGAIGIEMSSSSRHLLNPLARLEESTPSSQDGISPQLERKLRACTYFEHPCCPYTPSSRHRKNGDELSFISECWSNLIWHWSDSRSFDTVGAIMIQQAGLMIKACVQISRFLLSDNLKNTRNVTSKLILMITIIQSSSSDVYSTSLVPTVLVRDIVETLWD